MTVRAVVLARYPVPGSCKTRLIPGFGAEGAATIHRKLTEKTIATLRQSGLQFELWGTGADETNFTDWLGELTFREQTNGDLGARLAAAADPYPVMFLGTDCPGMTAAILQEAAHLLQAGSPAVLGPAEDGGYWTLGLTQPVASVFDEMPWGTDQVFAKTYERLEAEGLTPSLLPRLSDVDHPEDLEPWPELYP